MPGGVPQHLTVAGVVDMSGPDRVSGAIAGPGAMPRLVAGPGAVPVSDIVLGGTTLP